MQDEFTKTIDHTAFRSETKRTTGINTGVAAAYQGYASELKLRNRYSF